MKPAHAILRPRIAFRPALLCALLASLFASGCSVPLGPGYTVEKQQIEVRFVAGATPALEVRATYLVRNTGNRDLEFIEAALPDAKEFGRENLRVSVDGAEVTPQPAAEGSPTRVRIAFNAPVPQKQARSVVIEYRLQAAGMLSQDSFYLPTVGWYPILQSPKGLFAKGGVRPKKWDLSVRVPQGFLAHASGRRKGTKKQGGEVAHRFPQRPDDFDPFVVAGRYHEQRITSHGIRVHFLTFDPLNVKEATGIGERIASSVETYEKTFGPRLATHPPVWVVQAGSYYPCADPGQYTSKSPVVDLPESVLLCHGTSFAQGFDSDRYLFVDFALAATWFDYMTQPQGKDPTVSSGMIEYARFVADEARGEVFARRELIASLLQSYDQKPERRKRTLFLLALEERMGKETLQRSIRRMIQGLKGRTWSIDDLRIAIEVETGQDLGEFFRVWLNQPGIPEDFRKRYASK